MIGSDYFPFFIFYFFGEAYKWLISAMQMSWKKMIWIKTTLLIKIIQTWNGRRKNGMSEENGLRIFICLKNEVILSK